MTNIPAHGGELVNRIADGEEREKLLRLAVKANRLPVDDWTLADIDLIGSGAFSPLTGFMNEADYASVLQRMRLAGGVVWSLPVTLAVREEDWRPIRIGDPLALAGETDGAVYALLQVESKYEADPLAEALAVYGAADPEHPGVRRTLQRPAARIGGSLRIVRRKERGAFAKLCLDPAETRASFAAKGWRTVCGFQTRNPIHRAHEYIQKCALETVDGLFLHPLVGETKSDDLPADVRMKSYQAILAHYYPPGRVHLGAFPAAMRYAGPREAIFHALVRKNYGCTHFIVGRDHAGVGDYYGTYDAQHIFDRFSPEELGIVPLKFEHSFYCRRCGNMATAKTCPHDAASHLHLSGTKVRTMLRDGISPPPELTRPEVASILIEGLRTPRADSRD